MYILKGLTEEQKIALAARLASLTDCKEDRLFDGVFVAPALVGPLTNELVREGFIRREGGRIYPGPEIPRSPEAQAVLNRRDRILRADPLTKKLMGDPMTPERRRELLAASEQERAQLRAEDAPKKA